MNGCGPIAETGNRTTVKMLHSSERRIFIAFILYLTAIAGFINRAAAQSNVEAESVLLEQFEGFIKEHRKSYDSFEEKMMRFENFKNNLKDIEELNAEETGDAVYGVNRFSDMSHQEFLSIHTGFVNPADWDSEILTLSKDGAQEAETMRASEEPGDEESSGIPAKPTKKPKPTDGPNPQPTKALFDWRENNKYYPPVEDQGQCGSCWAFATTGTVEILESKKQGKIVRYSEQQVVDCTTENWECDGGWFPPAFKLMQNPGLAYESTYPYKAINMTCPKTLKYAMKIKGFKDVNGAANIVAALPTSPIAVAFNCGHKAFMHYKSGVVNVKAKKCKPDELTHAVIAIGHGADYWILRNSWGESYGEKGHFMLKKGLCGLETYAYSVQV